MATATNFVRGTVIQRSAVQRCAPPAHFVLCDPQTELTLLKLTLRAEDAAATGWRRARVWLWGVWCDRSADAVALGDVVTVRGAELERDEAAAPGDCGWSAFLPPRGASAGASVEVASAARVARITEDRITVEKRAAPPPAAAAAAAAAAPTSKRARGAPDAYDYTRIARLREMAAGGGGGAGGVAALAPKEVHVHAVVLAYTLPRETRGEDMKSTITLVDESCDGRGDALVVNFFKAHPKPPGIGAVVRFHRLRVTRCFDGVLHAEATRARGQSLTSWVFGDGDDPAADRSSGGFTWTADHTARARALREWALRTLPDADDDAPSPFSPPHRPAASVAAAAGAAASAAAANPDDHTPTELVVRLGGGGAAPAIGPVLVYEGRAPAAGALPNPSAVLRIDKELRAQPAQLILDHLRGAPRADFRLGWLRLSNVRLEPAGAAGGVAVVVHAHSTVVRLMDAFFEG